MKAEWNEWINYKTDDDDDGGGRGGDDNDDDEASDKPLKWVVFIYRPKYG